MWRRKRRLWCLCSLWFFPSAGDRPALPALKQQFSISELIVNRGDSQNHTVGLDETGLQEHTEENCLYCVGASVLGYPTQPQINSTHPRTGEPTHTHTHTMGHSNDFKLSAEYNNRFFSSQTSSTSRHGEGRAAIGWRWCLSPSSLGCRAAATPPCHKARSVARPHLLTLS